MGPTIDQIEAQIDRTREQLGSNLHELERRVDAATDWQEHYRARPFAFLGVAALGGLALAAMLRNSSRRWPAEASQFHSRMDAPSDQMLAVWNTAKAALVGLAATRLVDYVEELLPGFNEQYRRVDHRGPDSR